MKSKNAGGLPFASSVGDSIDLMKRMWGMAGLPGIPGPSELASMAVRLPTQLPNMLAPTIDVEELDKRIADLRAVEQWLELNAGLLRTTIQTLEVQRATITTLKSFSGAMLGTMTGKPATSAAAPARAPADLSNWPLSANPTAPGVMPATVLPTAAPAPAEVAPAVRAPRRRRKTASAARAAIEPALNPTAWWNTLQDQFSKIAAAAVATPAEKPAKSPAKTARKRAAKKRRR